MWLPLPERLWVSRGRFAELCVGANARRTQSKVGSSHWPGHAQHALCVLNLSSLSLARVRVRQDQLQSDNVLEDVACMLGCTRSSLHGATACWAHGPGAAWHSTGAWAVHERRVRAAGALDDSMCHCMARRLYFGRG